jgi:quercetin dioxygenase-like cupin family protein
MMMRTILVTFSKMFGLSVLMLTILLPNGSLAAERKIETTVLAKSTQDWGGSMLEQYADGQPEVTVARVRIPAGMALPLHEHPFMTAGVVLQGIIEVRTGSGKTHIARAGDAVVELVNQPHGGANIGDEDAVILVVYAGVEGQLVTLPITQTAP